MKKTILFLALASATLGLSGCGSEDKQTVDRSEVESQLGLDPAPMYFAYPSAGQQSVPTSTSVVVRFTSAIITEESELAGLFSLKAADGTQVNFQSAQLTENNQGILLIPETRLDPATDYTIVSEGVELTDRAGTLPTTPLTFRTAPTSKGPISLQIDGQDGFSLQRVAPYTLTNEDLAIGSGKYPITDISTLRLQFSEPLNSTSLIYGLSADGGTIALINAAGELVPAKMISRGHRLTIDPIGELSPGEDYQLVLKSGITSTINDSALTPVELTLSPVSTLSPNGVRERVPQVAYNDGGTQSLTGKTNNSVGLDSIMLGTGNQTIQYGNAFADLAFIPTFERLGQSVPLRIEAGTKLIGTNVPVLVAGKFPAGFESENVNVHFLSDADGYLMPNPYTDDPSAPRIMEIYADLSMTTDNTIANGGLAQSLLHVQLVGTAIVEEGTLVIEAIGVIEPDVLGVDSASGLISFKLEGYRNASDVPEIATDVVSPTIKSWVPGENSDLLRPGDPIVVFFSEPIDASTITKDSFTVSANGTALEGEISLNGSAVTFMPSEPLRHNIDYTLDITSEVSDLVGNTVSPIQERFSLPDTVEMPDGAPTNQALLALTSQPGFPCAKTAVSLDDLATGFQGRCSGSQDDDDSIPVLVHPDTRPITVSFSQNINIDSINAETVIVEVLADNTWAPADAVVKLTGRDLAITPQSPWAANTLYRYTLVSGENGIKSTAGLPFQTQFLNQANIPEADQPARRKSGVGNMVNYFLGGGKETRVFLPLKNLAAADVNGDLEVNSEEKGVVAVNNYAPIRNSSQVEIPSESVKSDPVSLGGFLPLPIVPVSDAQIGCEVGLSCPKDSYIYMSSGLDTEVSDEINESTNGRARVKLHPTSIYTSGVNVYTKVNPIVTPLVGAVGAIPTGPMSMRMRYQEDENGDRNQLIDGFITADENGQLTFETELDLYLDAPYLAPNISGALNHNLRSFKIDNLKLRGPITFLDDGRMQIEQRNIEDVTLDGITISGMVLLGTTKMSMSMAMKIPENGLYLNFLSPITQSK